MNPKNQSEKYWKEALTAEQFKICRKGGTEKPFTGKYVEWKEEGVFCCVCCESELFKSDHKFDSGTGWPSFWEVFDSGKVDLKEDRKLFSIRTEVTCHECGAHLGHVFDDGPDPTGKRYCINSVALKFRRNA